MQFLQGSWFDPDLLLLTLIADFYILPMLLESETSSSTVATGPSIHPPPFLPSEMRSAEISISRDMRAHWLAPRRENQESVTRSPFALWAQKSSPCMHHPPLLPYMLFLLRSMSTFCLSTYKIFTQFDIRFLRAERKVTVKKTNCAPLISLIANSLS